MTSVTIPATGAGDVTPKVATVQRATGEHEQYMTSDRWSGGKTAKTANVTASGDTTIWTPASGKKLRVFWVSAINDPDQSQSPKIILKFGTNEIYRGYAIAHWEIFDGAVDQALVCNLDQAGDVAITVHGQEL